MPTTPCFLFRSCIMQCHKCFFPFWTNTLLDCSPEQHYSQIHLLLTLTLCCISYSFTSLAYRGVVSGLLLIHHFFFLSLSQYKRSLYLSMFSLTSLYFCFYISEGRAMLRQLCFLSSLTPWYPLLSCTLGTSLSCCLFPYIVHYQPK